MTNCVTNLQKKSAEYIAAMDKFNISSGELEMILHEYLNLPENAKMFQEGKLSFPPDSYIQQALYGEESIVSDTNAVLMYEKVFSKPFITPDKTLAMQAANEAAKYFENKSIKIRETKDGQYQVLVTPPVFLGEKEFDPYNVSVVDEHYTEYAQKGLLPKKSEKKDSLISKFITKQSLSFRTRLVTASKSRFKTVAKLYIIESLSKEDGRKDAGKWAKAVDDFVNNFDDSFWEYVLYLSLNSSTRHDNNVATFFGVTTTIGTRLDYEAQSMFVFPNTISKSKLLDYLEETLNTKFRGVTQYYNNKKVKISEDLPYNILIKTLHSYYKYRNRNMSLQEHISLFAKDYNITIKEATALYENLQENSTIESSKKAEFIRNYSNLDSAISKINKAYSEELQSYINNKDKEADIKKALVRIIFNRSLTGTPLQRLFVVGHESYHALFSLSDSYHRNMVEKALSTLLETEQGNSFFNGYIDVLKNSSNIYEGLNYENLATTAKSELLSDLFAYISIPDILKPQLKDSGKRIKYVADFIEDSNILNKKKEFVFSTFEEKEVQIPGEWDIYKIKLNLVQRIWNTIASAINNLLHNFIKAIPVINDTKLIPKTITEISVKENTTIEQDTDAVKATDALLNLFEKLQTSAQQFILKESLQEQFSTHAFTDNSGELTFYEKQSKLKEQLDLVYGLDSEFTGEEFRQIAADIIYEISDIITEVEKNPEAILKYNSVAKVENVSGSSRASILSQIGIGNILDYIKKNNFSPFNGTTGNPNIAGRKDAKKAKIISNNINAFLTQGASLLLQLEGFGITDNLTVNEDVDTETIEDLNNDNERETIQETVGSLQEHWLIESRTENAFDKASVLVKQALTQCYKLNPNGTPVVSKWGIKQRMDGRESMLSVIRWTQGALTLSAMVKKLEALSKKNPWVLPIIERLKDTSGKESTFQSQFFGTVSKYFQLYSVGKKENGEYSVFEVNTHPALSDAKKSISGLYNAGAHPLFDSNGKVNETSYEQLKNILESLEKQTLTPENTESIAESLSNVSRLLGYPISKEALMEVLDAKTYQQMTKRSLQFIVKNLEENKNNASWQPFSGKKEDNGIINNIGKFITPITDLLEDVTNTSFYDSGNTYQSYVTPSYLTKLVLKFTNLSKEEFDQFIQDEFGKFEQFKQGDNWRNSWLELFENNPTAREVFAHKVQLNFAGNRYMLNRGGSKAMSEAELTLSILAEYFREEGFKTTKELAPAWFRVPLMSNKPSSEFIRFFSYRGPNYKDRVLKGCIQLFTQELSRIQTVKKRNELYTEDDPEWIENFDVKGSKFCFFDFLNDVENKRFHELVELVTTYTQKEGDTDNSKLDLYTTELTTLAKKLIKEHIESEFKKQYELWQNNGVVEATSQIKSIPENGVTAALENFFWNDFLAANNILNLTITDLAYYKNTEDVQKRLAQLHAPGIRPNLEARDFKGNKVADSKTRTLYLKDVEIDGKKIKSNIIANVKAVFLKKLDALEKNSPQYLASEALYKDIIKLFEEGINIADAQGYACPTSYRKKALLFGKWDTHSEEIYQKLIKGDYTFTDLKVAFQPLKPFVYTQVEHDTNIENGGLPTIKMGVQNKNSEYLLIMANAITQNEDTGLPNYLRAIYKIMEDSHKGTIDKDGNHIPRVDGIDTIQFESTVKTGKTGLIDITEALSTEEAEALLEGLIYEDKLNHKYDNTYLQELNFEDYCILQEIPLHFKDHEQLQGSQIRMIIPSDLNTDENVKYNVEGRNLTAQEFRDEYERTIAESIEDSIKELMEEFGIDEDAPKTKKEQNIALAKTLQKEILSSPRYGLDLLMACLLNEQGDFTIPLGDSIQSKRIEQLLNSIIKNRVNKQKIAGGPVVQVTNFGTSRQLNIRFKSKDGSTLFTLAEYIELGKTELEWLDYINDNQAGIAYYECFAPAYMLSIFELFMDAKGNIDVEAIEKTDPDLLKMIGYRIPSEDKYSLAPIKIVGFMPKEAGDGIMLPYEITLITGSDRDVIVSTSII